MQLVGSELWEMKCNASWHFRYFLERVTCSRAKRKLAHRLVVLAIMMRHALDPYYSTCAAMLPPLHSKISQSVAAHQNTFSRMMSVCTVMAEYDNQNQGA